MKSVKILIMEAVKEALTPLVSQTPKQGQGIPLDQDTARYPWICFFDELESKRANNRISQKTFDLVIQAWVKANLLTNSVDEQLDAIDAKIEQTIMNDPNIMARCLKIEPKSSEKFYVDDGETGILQSIFEVVYVHKWKDPYDPVRG